MRRNAEILTPAVHRLAVHFLPDEADDDKSWSFPKNHHPKHQRRAKGHKTAAEYQRKPHTQTQREDVSKCDGILRTPPSPRIWFSCSVPRNDGWVFFVYVKQHVVGALCRSLAWLAAAVCVCVTKTVVLSLAGRGSSI